MAGAAALPIQRFNAGETTKNLGGRTDLDWYGGACEILYNAIARPEGPATMRPGCWHAGLPRSPNAPTSGYVRLIGFVVEVDPLVAYMIEITDQKMRFWIGGVRTLVPDPGNPSIPLEVAAPWAAEDLPSLRTVQSADTMWIVHPLYPPQKLKRTGAVGGPYNFTLTQIVLSDGPYYAQDNSGVGLTLVGTNLAASAPFWSADDVGRIVRLGDGNTVWSWVVIIAFVDNQNVTIALGTGSGAVSSTAAFRLGLYSDRTGWPTCVCFHQERLFYGSNPASNFARVDGSQSSDFDNFAPDSIVGGTRSVADTSAVSYVLATDDLPKIRDLKSDRSLVALTSSVEMEMGTWQDTSALTPSSPPITRPAAREGSIDAPGLNIHDNIVLIQRYGRSLHELSYDFGKNGLKPRELSIRASHLGDGSPFSFAIWANRPWNVIWLLAQDGSYCGCTYTPEQSIIAFHQHGMAGNLQGDAAVLESIGVIPGSAGDEVWYCVRRTIGGIDRRHVGAFADALHEGQAQDEACYLDQAVQGRGTAPAADISFTVVDDETVTVKASAAVFDGSSVGKRIIAVKAEGREVDGSRKWMRLQLDVTVFVDASTLTCSRAAAWLPKSNRIASGNWYFGATTLSVPHLIGETVGLLCDGAAMAERVVPASGILALEQPTAIATAGLPYDMIVQPVEQEGGGRQGATGTRIKNGPQVGLKVVRSGEFEGGAPDNMFPVGARDAADLVGQAPPLFTGVRLIGTSSGEDARIFRWRVQARGPLPVTIASAVEHREVGEAVP